ncbi:hypothetical protein PoB_001981900 [Plakobranchus ocellatus]|uniref:C-type lectin domain-containing protein n=1 Tax=Plakobranchus ocellatus TaxID=259542 RepID=A0AAV3ZD59_9GAST|nr:hypothetical protein PoB_001981900 [Plakobranchus ocellatus]
MLAVVIFLTIWISTAPSHAGESTAPCSSAPIQGGTKLHKPYRGKCYTFYAHPDSKKQYWEAQKECEKNQGNLAMPKTKEANQFLVDSLLGLIGHKKKRRLYVCENENDELSAVSKPTTTSDVGDKTTQHSDTLDPSKVALPKDDQQNDSNVSSASAAKSSRLISPMSIFNDENADMLNTLATIETMMAMTVLMFLGLESLTRLLP